MKRIHVAAFALVLAFLATSLLPAPGGAIVPGPNYCESLGPFTVSGFGECINLCQQQGCTVGSYQPATGTCACATPY